VKNTVENPDETVENAVKNSVNKPAKTLLKVIHRFRPFIHQKNFVIHNFSTAARRPEMPTAEALRRPRPPLSTVFTAHHKHHYIYPLLLIKRKYKMIVLVGHCGGGKLRKDGRKKHFRPSKKRKVGS